MKYLICLFFIGVSAGAWLPKVVKVTKSTAQATQEETQDDAESAPPIELGTVNWLRDLDTAIADSKKSDKPIAILFQEVPG